MRAVEWLLRELQSRDAPEATRKALEHWLNLERAWQCIGAINGRLKERTFPTDLAIAHNNSAVRKTSTPHTARIHDESQPGHGQGKAS
jgi:ferric-dicitrate binding protein FerR (iron transport regulator)